MMRRRRDKTNYIQFNWDELNNKKAPSLFGLTINSYQS